MKTKETLFETKLSRRSTLKILTALGLGGSAFAMELSQQPVFVQKNIPGTQEKLPVIGMGTWQTFDIDLNGNKKESIKEVLRLFAASKGRCIDSSPMYGRSEEVVGQLSKELGIQSSLFLATKVWTHGKEDGIRQMNESMRLMKTKQMDLMQIHNLVDWKTHLKTLRSWKDQGKIRYIGITHYVPSAFDRLAQIMKTEPIDFVQLPYSIQMRKADKYLLPLAQEKEIGVLVNRPYEGGNLFRYAKNKQLPEWAKDFDCHSWGQFFLKYIVSHPAVTCAIPATSKPKHMKDNMGACYGKLPDAKMREKMMRFFDGS